MAPMRPTPLLVAATAVAVAVAVATMGVAAASAGGVAVRQGREYTVAAAAPSRHPCSPSPPAASTSPPVAGTSPPVAATSSPVAGTSTPVEGTVPPVAATASPVASATPPPAPSGTLPPPSTPTPLPGLEAELPIPTLPPDCVAPSVDSILSQDLFFSLISWQWQTTLVVCDAADLRFRLTLYTAPAGATEPATRVYQAIEDGGGGGSGGGGSGVRRVSVPPFGGFVANRSCVTRSIYGEACVADATTGAPVCIRTETREVTALPQPPLRISEPIPVPSLALAPGDGASFTINVTSGLDENNMGQKGPSALRLVPILRRANGTTIRSDAVVVEAGRPAVVRNDLLSAGVTAADDGAVVGVEVSRISCSPGNSSTVVVGGNTDGGNGTVLSVSPDTPSLVQQDTQLPTIVSVVYPPTAQGEPVNITVTATNEGGGRRRSGDGDGGALVPVALTYQWLKESRAFTVLPNPSRPDVLAGETAAVLQLPAAVCLSFAGSCGRFGCAGLERYRVDVCNTFGCTRSGIIEPAILRPADEELAQQLERSSSAASSSLFLLQGGGLVGLPRTPSTLSVRAVAHPRPTCGVVLVLLWPCLTSWAQWAAVPAMGPWSPSTSTALADLRPDALEGLWLADLPEDRADAPEVWDQAVQLLSAATLEAAHSLNRVVVTQAQLTPLLELHGATPVCLPVVFEQLVRSGSLRRSPLLPGPVSPFGGGSGATPAGASGLRRAVDAFWTTLGYLPSAPPAPPITPTTPLVLPTAIRTAADKAMAALAAPSRIEAVTSLAAVATAACDGDLSSAAVVVDHLAEAGKVALQPDVPALSPTRGVKFCDVTAGFTSVDASVLALKAAISRLDALDATLTAGAASARTSAKAALASGNPALAKRYLRREAGLRSRLDANAGAGANLAAALAAVDTADGNRETVAALAAGNAALKELSGPDAPSAADVDALAVEFGELTEDVEGVSAALAQGSSAGADVDADAEAELEAMEAAMAAERAAVEAAARKKAAADAATAAERARRAAAAKEAAATEADAADAAGQLAAMATAGEGTPAASSAGTTGGAGGKADNTGARLASTTGEAGDGVDDLLTGLDSLRVSESPTGAATADEPDEQPRAEGRVQVPG